jgi:hypothetical protein
LVALLAALRRREPVPVKVRNNGRNK